MAQPLENEPRDLLLDDQNDLVIENGDFVLARGIDGVVQSCRIALQMCEGEWFLNLDAGIPYWQQILGFKPQVAVRAAKVAFQSELLAVSGVQSVTKLDVDFDSLTRAMSVTWQVKTSLGETPPDTIALAVTNSGVA